MAVPIGEARNPYFKSNDTFSSTVALRGMLKNAIEVDTEAMTYPAPMNYGDINSNMRSETTDLPMFIQTDKTDQFNPVHTVVDKAGKPDTNYSVDPDSGRIRYAPITGGGRPAGGMWHGRNETNQDYYFGRHLTLSSVPAGPCNVTVSGNVSFWLYVNGTLVGAGKSGVNKTVDIQPFLRVGENDVTVRAYNTGVATPYVAATGTVATANDINSTSVSNWSTSRYSVMGIAGQVTYLNRQHGDLTKRQDRISRSLTALESLTAMLRAESQSFEQLLSTVK